MKIRILIIDDEPRWINFVKQEFGAFEVVVAKNTEEARHCLEEDMFTLIITSARWLKMFQEMGEIFSQKYSDKTVVVTITPNIDEALQVYNLGVVLYIPKSFGQHELFMKIKEVIPEKSLLLKEN
jgi:DNA-binding NtrC family response regulator